MHSFEIASDLSAPPEAVWRHAIGLRGINNELMPLMRMTTPRGLSDAAIDQMPLGRPLGRAWMLLFGLLPVDFDDLTIAEYEARPPLRGAVNDDDPSRWRHERIVEPCDSGCRVIDRLHWHGRTAFLSQLFRLAVPVLFRHRHRRLRRRFGSA